jgi:very-short-patch-repair endonuclease
MSNKLTDARARAADLLSNAYAVLRVVEHQLTDNEARLLLDIAQAIDTLEVMLDADEEEQ